MTGVARARSSAARRWPLALALVLAATAGCGGGERIAECDALIATIEQVAACHRLDAAQRVQLRQASRSLEEALDRLEDVGPDLAPPQILGEARRTCVLKDGEVRRQYEKDAPECLR